MRGGNQQQRSDFFRRFLFEHEDVYMALIAFLVGVAAGYGNIIFRLLIEFFQYLFYGTSSEFILDTVVALPKWKLVAIPAAGGLLVGLIAFFFRSAKGHGVPDVIKAILLNRAIKPSVAVIKTVSSAITLGSGGSAGREGPIVQIGAAIGSGVGLLFKFSSSRMRTIIACGAAAGLAGTFNAPIGGAMFAAEILLGDFALRSFSPVIISAVTATVISRAHLGNHVTFLAPDYVLRSFMELPLYAVLGIVSAVIGVIFIRVFYAFENSFQKLNAPSWMKPAIGGALMGCVAIISPHVMGVGYDTIYSVLNARTFGMELAVIIVLKIIATSLTLGSGGSGGLFVPSLVLGAATGGFFGWGAGILFPSIAASPGAYGLVAMSAMLGATIRAPITAILIIFEITQSYEIILPVMLAAIVANVLANVIEKDSIFSWVLTRQGIRLNRGADEKLLDSVHVSEVMLTNVTTFRETTSFREVMHSVQKAPHLYFPVLDKNDYLVGMLSLENIKGVLFEEGLEDIIVAGEICTRKNLIYVQPEDTLAKALHTFGIKDLGDLPVVEKDETGRLKLLGLLRRSDILISYNKKLMEVYPN